MACPHGSWPPNPNAANAVSGEGVANAIAGVGERRTSSTSIGPDNGNQSSNNNPNNNPNNNATNGSSSNHNGSSVMSMSMGMSTSGNGVGDTASGGSRGSGGGSSSSSNLGRGGGGGGAGKSARVPAPGRGRGEASQQQKQRHQHQHQPQPQQQQHLGPGDSSASNSQANTLSIYGSSIASQEHMGGGAAAKGSGSGPGSAGDARGDAEARGDVKRQYPGKNAGDLRDAKDGSMVPTWQPQRCGGVGGVGKRRMVLAKRRHPSSRLSSRSRPYPYPYPYPFIPHEHTSSSSAAPQGQSQSQSQQRPLYHQQHQHQHQRQALRQQTEPQARKQKDPKQKDPKQQPPQQPPPLQGSSPAAAACRSSPETMRESSAALALAGAFSFLPLSEQARCSHVCKFWAWVVSNLLTVRSLTIRSESHLLQAVRGFARRVQGLRFRPGVQASPATLSSALRWYGGALRSLLLEADNPEGCFPLFAHPAAPLPKLELLSCHVGYITGGGGGGDPLHDNDNDDDDPNSPNSNPNNNPNNNPNSNPSSNPSNPNPNASPSSEKNSSTPSDDNNGSPPAAGATGAAAAGIAAPSSSPEEPGEPGSTNTSIPNSASNSNSGSRSPSGSNTSQQEAAAASRSRVINEIDDGDEDEDMLEEDDDEEEDMKIGGQLGPATGAHQPEPMDTAVATGAPSRQATSRKFSECAQSHGVSPKRRRVLPPRTGRFQLQREEERRERRAMHQHRFPSSSLGPLAHGPAIFPSDPRPQPHPLVQHPQNVAPSLKHLRIFSPLFPGSSPADSGGSTGSDQGSDEGVASSGSGSGDAKEGSPHSGSGSGSNKTDSTGNNNPNGERKPPVARLSTPNGASSSNGGLSALFTGPAQSDTASNLSCNFSSRAMKGGNGSSSNSSGGGGGGFGPTGAAVQIISTFTNLRTLVLTRIDLRSTSNVRSLFSSGLPLLENLELDSTGITDAGIAVFSRTCHNVQRNMRYLLVGSHEPNEVPSVTDEALKHIGSINTLLALDIAYQSTITATGIRNALVGLPKLRFLNLDATGANDKIAGMIAKHGKSLRWLSMQSCKITDEGIRMLATLPQLRELGVTYCEDLTPNCVQSLVNSASLETVELLDATRSSGISQEAADTIGRRIKRENKPDLNMFNWTIGTIGEQFLPAAFANPLLHPRSSTWILRDSQSDSSGGPRSYPTYVSTPSDNPTGSSQTLTESADKDPVSILRSRSRSSRSHSGDTYRTPFSQNMPPQRAHSISSSSNYNVQQFSSQNLPLQQLTFQPSSFRSIPHPTASHQHRAQTQQQHAQHSQQLHRRLANRHPEPPAPMEEEEEEE